MPGQTTIQLPFPTATRVGWLATICEARRIQLRRGDNVIFCFPDISVERIRPEHIVLLACLVEYLDHRGINVKVSNQYPVSGYLIEQLRLHEYWKGGQNYVEAKSSNILNLWRFDSSTKDIHAKRISEYLRNTFFKKKDLSAVEMSLTEAYYNIQDHAKSNNAFSMVSFEPDEETLNVAICDFGIGIPTSVRTVCPDIVDDRQALIKAMEDDFTVGSRIHNAGKGLGNIRSSCTQDDYLWIISNRAAMVTSEAQEKVFNFGFNFEGTLILYSMSLSHFDDEEIITDFNW